MSSTPVTDQRIEMVEMLIALNWLLHNVHTY